MLSETKYFYERHINMLAKKKQKEISHNEFKLNTTNLKSTLSK